MVVGLEEQARRLGFFLSFCTMASKEDGFSMAHWWPCDSAGPIGCSNASRAVHTSIIMRCKKNVRSKLYQLISNLVCAHWACQMISLYQRNHCCVENNSVWHWHEWNSFRPLDKDKQPLWPFISLPFMMHVVLSTSSTSSWLEICGSHQWISQRWQLSWRILLVEGWLSVAGQPFICTHVIHLKVFTYTKMLHDAR